MRGLLEGQFQEKLPNLPCILEACYSKQSGGELSFLQEDFCMRTSFSRLRHGEVGGGIFAAIGRHNDGVCEMNAHRSPISPNHIYRRVVAEMIDLHRNIVNE